MRTATTAMLRVVIADDSVLLREGLARLLPEAGFAVIGQAGSAGDLLALVDELRPDVAIVDIRMPPFAGDDGIRAAEQIRQHHPQTGVLVLSQFVEPAFAMRLLTEQVGGTGYLLKERVTDLDEFADAIHRVARGGSVVDPEVVAQLLRRGRETSPIEALTDREQEVLGLMAEGRSNQAICERLYVTPKTVEAHVSNIFSKLGLLPAPDDHRRVLAVLAYLDSVERPRTN